MDLAATPPFLEDHIRRNSENTLVLDSRRQEQLPVFHQSAIFTPKRNVMYLLICDSLLHLFSLKLEVSSFQELIFFPDVFTYNQKYDKTG